MRSNERDNIYGTTNPTWKMTTIGELVQSGRADLQTGPFGTHLQASAYVPVGTPVIAVRDIADNRVIHGQSPCISAGDVERLSHYKLQTGDIIFARKGAVERRALIRTAESGWLQGSDCIRLRILHESIDPVYVSYVFGSRPYTEWILSNAQGATMPSLNQEIIGRIPLPLPPLPEQKRIAHILGSLDDKIELNRQMNKTLEAMAQALFKSWFIDFDPVHAKMEGRDPSGMDPQTAALFPNKLTDSPLGPIPEGWGIGKIAEIIQITPRYQLSRGDVAPYLGMADAPEEGHFPHGWYDREFNGSGSKFKNGDTLMAKITPCLENGKTAFVDFLPEDTIGWGSTEYLVLRSKPPFPLEYSYYLARSRPIRQRAIQSMTGSSGRQRVPVRAFRDFLIVIPPPDIAESFGTSVRKLMTRIRKNYEESRTMTQVRDMLLPELLSGKL